MTEGGGVRYHVGMFWWKPYEPLLEQKAKAGDAVVVELIARELVEVLEAFPPAEHDVDWSDERFAARFRERLPSLPRPDARFVGLLLKLVRLDVEHEAEQIDWMIRNGHHKDACPTAAHEHALHFLWPLVVEHLYQRKDECNGILTRKHLLRICDEAEERFRRRALQIV
jgi:hypothetical protein